MTTPVLFGYICATILFQLAAVISIALWRRRTYGTPRLVTPTLVPEDAALAWSGWRDFRVTHRLFEDSAHTQCSFYLEPVNGAALPPFQPGQFLTFSLPIFPDRPTVRCYSLSDRPDPKSYRITVKRIPASTDKPDVPPGIASNFLHDRVHEGDIIKVKAPSGRFCLDPDPSAAVVFIAGGIGITPLLSMLRWCASEQPERSVYLYYGVRNATEHGFREALEELTRTCRQLHVCTVYSRASSGDVQGRNYDYAGHVDLDLLRRTLPHGRHQFYVCGPAAMLDSLIPALSTWGVPAQDIHYEAFGPASFRSPFSAQEKSQKDATAAWEVHFRRSGRTLVWDGQDANLLQFAERHGVAVESGCRAGSCGSCETALVSGTVLYAHEPDHPVASGHCLLCVGTPGSALVLEA